MKKTKLIKLYILLNIALFCALFSKAQTTTVNWAGKISIGGDTVKVNCNILMKESAELFLEKNSLEVTGNFSGETGSEIYISSDFNRNGFIDISGTATGSMEIIPDIYPAWDGSRMDFVKAEKNGSQTSAFRMKHNLVDLRFDIQNYNMFWYVEDNKLNSCLPIIVQLGNHTLLVNNNSETNGSYKFVYYHWYKDGILIKEGTHNDDAGSYYTGGEELDKNAEYTVKVTDSKGANYLSCPYRYVHSLSPINVTVYPNPVPRNTKANIIVETQDLSLLTNAIIEIYDLLGQCIGKTNVNGQTIINMDFPAKSGIYILKFRAKDYLTNIKITVK